MLLWLWLWACGGELIGVPGTTTRVSPPQAVEGTELELGIFATKADCVGADVSPEDIPLCLPHVDRRSGEVRLAYQFRLNEFEYYMPAYEEQLEVSHQGTLVQDGIAGQSKTIIPHDPRPVRQLFILLIDGSSSMADHGRMKKVRGALLRKQVKQAFFPKDTKTGVVLMQFTQGQPQPVGGELQILWNVRDYVEKVKQLRVLSGYTHLFDAVTYATGALLQEPVIDTAIQTDQMAVTVVALTDGFNNVARDDTCADNAPRLQTLLAHLRDVREGDGADLRSRPSVFTVGLGRPLRPMFKLPDKGADKVTPKALCGGRYRSRRIDGDLERNGIDNASLTWIADRGGGFSYVRQDQEGLGEAFRSAAAKRYTWFEVRYRVDPFYLRRSFRTRLRLLSYATAEASIMVHPSAWLDAPPGKVGADGWTEPQTFWQTLTLVMPALGLLVALSFVGAAWFNTRRALFGRMRQPRRKRAATKPPPKA